MTNTEIQKLAHDWLIKTAKESIRYVALGNAMPRDLAVETGITENEASLLLAVLSGKLIVELEKIDERL